MNMLVHHSLRLHDFEHWDEGELPEPLPFHNQHLLEFYYHMSRTDTKKHKYIQKLRYNNVK
jgi:hypothetical protein